MSRLVERLIAFGAPADIIADAAKLIARAELEDDRRKRDRERKASVRGNPGIPRTSGNSADTVQDGTIPSANGHAAAATASKNGNSGSAEPEFPTLKASSSLSSSGEPSEIQQRKEEQVEAQNTTKQKRPRYSEDFERRFWLPYPRTKTMGKKEAWDQWQKLSPEDRDAAVAAIQPYKAELAKNGWQSAIHAGRFLLKRRFESFAEANKPPQQTAIPADMPEPLHEFWSRGWRKGNAFSPPMRRKCPELEPEYGHRSEASRSDEANGQRILHQGSSLPNTTS